LPSGPETEAQTEFQEGGEMMKNFGFALGIIAVVITLLVFQRDFIYGTRGNLGQGTHPII
jgi:hypothetical protein